jgi:membrane-associated phospholipid phosphatase
VVAAGVIAPLVRKRLAMRPAVTHTIAFSAPVALCVAVPRSRKRDVATCTLQMWAYLCAYKSPHDDPQALERRVHVEYPIAVDRVLGLGQLPTVRLQRTLARRRGQGMEQWPLRDRVLVWAHWIWFLVPHGSLLYILARHRRRFERSAVMTYAVFDIGAVLYWAVPTAPPWYATTRAGRTGGGDGEGEAEAEAEGDPEVRRLMVEYGEAFWGDGWAPLYSVLGGNPLAAMPSLHFATSVMAAQLLAETGTVAGTVGWIYASTLGFALVYLGEHYVVDLLAGAALTTAVRRIGPRLGPLLGEAGRLVAALEARAHEA